MKYVHNLGCFAARFLWSYSLGNLTLRTSAGSQPQPIALGTSRFQPKPIARARTRFQPKARTKARYCCS